MTADPGPGSGRPAARPAAFLPGPVPDRETLEGWTRWRLTRRDFVPAPVITAACCPSLKIPMRAALRIPMWGCGKAPQPWWLRGLGGGGAGGCG